MFNDDIKNEFLNNNIPSAGVRKSFEILFNNISKFESHFQKDFCQMNKRECTFTLNNIFESNRESTRRVSIAMLKRYLNWALDNVEGSVYVIDDIELNKDMSSKLIKSPKHLKEYLDIVFDSEKLMTVDNTYRMFFWLAYSGGDLNDIFKISTRDVDLNNCKIKCGDKLLPIYKDSVESLKFCLKAKQIVYKHPLYSDRLRNRASGDQLLRGFSEAQKTSLVPIITRKIKDKISMGKTDIELTHYRAWVSGLFYRLYMNELSGKKIIFKNDNYIGTRDVDIDNPRTIILNYSYKKDYEHWKNNIKLKR